MKVRQEELNAGEEQAVGQAVENLVAFRAADFEIERARFDGAQRVAARAAARVELANRQDQELGVRIERALTHRVEFADRLDDIAEQLDTQRLRMRRREDVEDAATHAEVAAVFDERHAAVAPIVELRGQRVEVDLVAFHQVAQAVRHARPWRYALQQRVGRRDDDRVLGLQQVVEALDARGNGLGRG
jgi:hypothetical protein